MCGNAQFPNVIHEAARCETSVARSKITCWQTVHLHSALELIDVIHDCLGLF